MEETVNSLPSPFDRSRKSINHREKGKGSAVYSSLLDRTIPPVRTTNLWIDGKAEKASSYAYARGVGREGVLTMDLSDPK